MEGRVGGHGTWLDGLSAKELKRHMGNETSHRGETPCGIGAWANPSWAIGSWVFWFLRSQ
jgi:hypothetical protein